MKILAEVGLVRSNRVGSEAIYILVPQSLVLTSEWVTTIMVQWDARLQKVYDYLVDEEVDETETREETEAWPQLPQAVVNGVHG